MFYSQEEIQESLRRGDLSQITTMIVDGVDVNSIVLSKKTDVLLEAIVRNNFSLLSLVLNKKFNCKNPNFFYIHHTIRTGRIEFVEKIINYYIENKCNFNEIDNNGNNLLHTACSTPYYLNIEIISLLNKVGISWTHKNQNGQTPLHFILRNTSYIEEDILNILLKDKKIFYKKDNLGITPADIVKSYSQDDSWKTLKNNQLLIKALEEPQ